MRSREESNQPGSEIWSSFEALSPMAVSQWSTNNPKNKWQTLQTLPLNPLNNFHAVGRLGLAYPVKWQMPTGRYTTPLQCLNILQLQLMKSLETEALEQFASHSLVVLPAIQRCIEDTLGPCMRCTNAKVLECACLRWVHLHEEGCSTCPSS